MISLDKNFSYYAEGAMWLSLSFIVYPKVSLSSYSTEPSLDCVRPLKIVFDPT